MYDTNIFIAYDWSLSRPGLNPNIILGHLSLMGQGTRVHVYLPWQAQNTYITALILNL